MGIGEMVNLILNLPGEMSARGLELGKLSVSTYGGGGRLLGAMDMIEAIQKVCQVKFKDQR